jgi:hypothetical protein
MGQRPKAVSVDPEDAMSPKTSRSEVGEPRIERNEEGNG